ncbi:MAG: ORF6N domain-containing protein [Bacteroidetes bacterium]|nr:ORF6N domain-containing protein [Bacteroidota bacterium]
MQLQHITTKIHKIRGMKVMLDYDLAELYETETKYLKRSVRANIRRFPPDFMFELSKDEFKNLRCNNSTSNKQGGTRYLPFAFTEQGVAMLSTVLSSEKAIEVNIAIIRTFVLIRQFALSHKELTEKLKEMENKYNQHFHTIYEAIDYLMKNDEVDKKQKNRRRIGFK